MFLRWYEWSASLPGRFNPLHSGLHWPHSSFGCGGQETKPETARILVIVPAVHEACRITKTFFVRTKTPADPATRRARKQTERIISCSVFRTGFHYADRTQYRPTTYQAVVQTLPEWSNNYVPEGPAQAGHECTNGQLYSHGPHNDVSVNDGPHIRRWSHNIIILTTVTWHCTVLVSSCNICM